MSEKIKRISRLIEAAQIEDIRLVEATAQTRIRSAKDAGLVDLKIKMSANVKERHKDGTFFVLAILEARVVSPQSPEDPAVSVKAGFELKYRLPKAFPATRRDLDMFAKVNSLFNAWPYWREFVQNTVTRMNLPRVVLPLFRLADIAKTIPKETSRAKAG